MVEMNAKQSQSVPMRIRELQFLEPIQQPCSSPTLEPENPYEKINPRKNYEQKCTNNYSTSEDFHSDNSFYREVRNSCSDKGDYVYLKINN